MLRDVAKASAMDTDTLKALRAEQGTRLMLLQQQVRAAKIPVIVLFEGWDASGKGSMIGELIRNLDPRGFKVFTLDVDDPAEERYPYMHRYWNVVPLYGNMAILDGSWYRGVADPEVRPGHKELERRYGQIIDFEKQLADDGYVILKFFLHITRKEQKQRFEALEDSAETRWRVTKQDWKHNKEYDELLAAYDEMLERTDKPWAPWTAIHATDRRLVASQVYSVVISALDAALRQKEADAARRKDQDKSAKQAKADAKADAKSDAKSEAKPEAKPAAALELPTRETVARESGARLMAMPRLRDIDLKHEVADEQYRAELKDAQQRLGELHNRLYQKKMPVVLGFEGWDAAGKGGAIKRLTRALDPRGFEVVPTAAPSPVELNHQYLWRFWRALPKDGHITIFDRTWYGRVMVERIEGFARPDQWLRAYTEINQFERSLTEWGAVVLKFWLHIDPDEQLRRFTDRQQTPEKQWKITDEDWRNRDKWPQYEEAVDQMLSLTSSVDAPWIIVESNDKRYARLKVLESVITALEERL